MSVEVNQKSCSKDVEREFIRPCILEYFQTSNKSGILVGNKIVHHSDVVWASPVSATPTTSSFPT